MIDSVNTNIIIFQLQCACATFHVFQEMDLRTNFSPNHNYLASASHDGVLKIYDVDTSTIKQQYAPSAHLTTTCTCLSWAPHEVTEVKIYQFKSKD